MGKYLLLLYIFFSSLNSIAYESLLFDTKKNYIDISNKIKIQVNNNIYSCITEEYLTQNTKILWFANDKLLYVLTNQNYITEASIRFNAIKTNNLTCLMVIEDNFKNIKIGLDTIDFSEDVINVISEPKYLFFIKNKYYKQIIQFYSNKTNIYNINCFIENSTKIKITNNLCYLIKKNKIVLDFTNKIEQNIITYIQNSYKPDIYYQSPFNLVINVFNNTSHKEINIPLYFLNFSVKPHIYQMTLTDKICYFSIKEKNNEHLVVKVILKQKNIIKEQWYATFKQNNSELLNYDTNIQAFYGSLATNNSDSCEIFVSNGILFNSKEVNKNKQFINNNFVTQKNQRLKIQQNNNIFTNINKNYAPIKKLEFAKFKYHNIYNLFFYSYNLELPKTYKLLNFNSCLSVNNLCSQIKYVNNQIYLNIFNQQVINHNILLNLSVLNIEENKQYEIYTIAQIF